MKVVVLEAFPRKTGYTQQCINDFLEGAAGKADIERIDLTSIDIHPCRGCFHCWTVTPGVCIQKDGMAQIIERYLTADIVVCVTPLYAYAVSSYLKIFQERTFPLLTPGVEFTVQGMDRNISRFPHRGPKKLAAVIVGGLKDHRLMKGAVESLRFYAEGFGMEFSGALVRPESFILQFSDTKPKTSKRIKDAFFRAGRMLVTDGVLSDELFENVSLPLASDNVAFARYSNVYWEYAEHEQDAQRVRYLTNRDVRILIYEMASGVDAVATKHITASFLFQFPDLNRVYSLLVRHGTCTIQERACPEPDLTITCNSESWSKVVCRETDPLKLLGKGEIRLEGDISLFRKLGRYFPPPKT